MTYALIADRNSILTGNIEDYPSGIIIPINKPYRWTSADVIRKMKYSAIKHFGKKNLKVGHAGTLDPLATGVLLVCIGKATKLAQELQSHEKQYLAGVSFGATTPSYDLEKDIDCRYPIDKVSKETLEAVIPSFIGEQEQVAPLFSAKSVDGTRAYEMARKQYVEAARNGGAFDHTAAQTLSRQNIVISEMELLYFGPRRENNDSATSPGNLRPNPRINVADTSSLNLPHADILVTCSKGTYIRALARDLGEALGSGAHLDSLRRTRSGTFRVEDALSVEEALSILD